MARAWRRVTRPAAILLSVLMLAVLLLRAGFTASRQGPAAPQEGWYVDTEIDFPVTHGPDGARQWAVKTNGTVSLESKNDRTFRDPKLRARLTGGAAGAFTLRANGRCLVAGGPLGVHNDQQLKLGSCDRAATFRALSGGVLQDAGTGKCAGLDLDPGRWKSTMPTKPVDVILRPGGRGWCEAGKVGDLNTFRFPPPELPKASKALKNAPSSAPPIPASADKPKLAFGTAKH